MAEITQENGAWHFDGEEIRIVPGSGRGTHPLRAALGEVTVPLAAVAGVSFEPGRKAGRRTGPGGRLRLRMRPGADPFTQATAGRLPEAADPYLLEVDRGGAAVAEYLAAEVRDARLLEQVPDGPADRYLLPGPPVPLVLKGSDGTLLFDGELLRLEWGWAAEESKKSAGVRTMPFTELAGVEWALAQGFENGFLRLLTRGPQVRVKPAHDPYCVVLWGLRSARETAQVAVMAAALTARLPHPFEPARGAAAESAAEPPAALPGAPAPAPVPASAPGPAAAAAAAPEDHDALLRRLRELGELHAAGILTEEEFRAAKKAVLDRF
ncbi:DUF4429 domain-containing protein [Streptomyces sp. YIM 98790]|uniref:DUF4429 domain-containing protein n=1 Tax=Streptomyces sp. YIM 98790 TaxID=2689077 RepID=UPI00140C70BA|nr:DUF4429 domain-containing protein [Streptomyces sp. YIM 98790]